MCRNPQKYWTTCRDPDRRGLSRDGSFQVGDIVQYKNQINYSFIVTSLDVLDHFAEIEVHGRPEDAGCSTTFLRDNPSWLRPGWRSVVPLKRLSHPTLPFNDYSATSLPEIQRQLQVEAGPEGEEEARSLGAAAGSDIARSTVGSLIVDVERKSSVRLRYDYGDWEMHIPETAAEDTALDHVPNRGTGAFVPGDIVSLRLPQGKDVS